MQYKDPVFEGRLKKRYKRFFADVEVDGKTVVAHCPNTGSMKGCVEPGFPCRITHVDDPKRKLKYTLQQIKTSSSWVGVNTHYANTLVWEAWEKQLIPHWKKFDSAKREVKISDKSRLDLVLFKNEEPVHYIEVKSVTMAEDGIALFPDAETTRGQKHLQELMDIQASGKSAEIFFMIQRTDCDVFSPAKDIDPKYAELLKECKKFGVKISAFAVSIKKGGIEVDATRKIKIKL